MKKGKGLKILLIVLLVIVALVVGAVFALTNYAKSIVEDMQGETTADYDLSISEVDGYKNILFLGVDSRDMSNMESTRSDAIMVVSLNETEGDINIASVYRDTYLKMGNSESYDKITHACMYGGPELVMKTLNESMDLDMSNYVMVNFKAVADIVDAVGGIEVDVQDYEISQLNKYTKETAGNLGVEDYQLVESSGVQTLEGVQAVAYSRIRKGVGDDFKRTERMRTVLTAIFEKIQGLSIGEMLDMVDIMRTQVKTNLSFEDIVALGKMAPELSVNDSIGWPYDVSTPTINGVSYVAPINLAANTTRLHNEFFNDEDYVAPDSVYQMSAVIASRTS